MRICFITSEIFWGKRRGGFGKLVRVVGRELVKRGFEVSVICWSEPDEFSPTELDGMQILSYPYSITSHSIFRHLVDYTKVVPLIRKADADVYLSIDCMVETYLAQKIMPDRKHVIWAQDPFDESDYKLLSSVDPNYKFNRLKFWVTTELYRRAYKKADLILTHAKYFKPKISRLYHINPDEIIYLPNPIEHIPDESSIVKSEKPTVCFLGRMDPQKRYWIFFELAKSFHDIKFIAIGKPSLLYEELYRRILKDYEKLENLEVMGFVDDEIKSRILSRSWVMVLPSIREGLPIAFLEALSHGCALLSSVNPDNIVSKFGYYAAKDEFEKGLCALLKDNMWRVKGRSGYNYVKRTHNLSRIIDKLLKYLKDP